LAREIFFDLMGIPQEISIGIGCAKDISEIQLTESAIQVKFADCPRTKKNKN